MAVKAWVGTEWEYPNDIPSDSDSFTAVVLLDNRHDGMVFAKYEGGKWTSLEDGSRVERKQRPNDMSTSGGYKEITAFLRVPVPAIQSERNAFCESLYEQKKFYLLALPVAEPEEVELEAFMHKDERIRISPVNKRVRVSVNTQ
jgi:hypothetical protein